MIQLNLLPDIKKEFINAQKTKNMVISISILTTLGALGITALLFIYVNFLQQLQISAVNRDIARKTSELKSVNDIDKYLTIQNQLRSLPALHDQKGIYSRLLSFLPTINPSAPNNISLSALQLTEVDKSITFTGTTKSFESFNVFVDTLRNAEVSYKTGLEDGADVKKEKLFETVAVQTSGLGKSGTVTVVNFTVKATYKDAVFSALSYDVSVSVPSIQTTQSVTDSPKPASLFEGNVPTGEGQ